MILRDKVDRIIENRKAKIPGIQNSFNKINEITEVLERINQLRNEIIEKEDEIKVDSDIIKKIKDINFSEYWNAFNVLKKQYDRIIQRFERDEINISVVGSARQGKSKLLQSISSLDDSVIPAFESDDCTGATSVIRNIPGESVSAYVNFMTKDEMIQCIQRYLDVIFGQSTIKLHSFGEIGELNLVELRQKIEPGSPVMTKFEHLSKYVEHFDEWSQMIKKGNIHITDPKEIQKYVAQHNGKNEGENGRENYYYYLAVKDVTISCEFRNPEAGKIVLRDTIGLGDTSLGIEDKMLEAIGDYSDAAIIVRRPEVAVGKFDERDDILYKKIYEQFNNRHMDKWLFWIINRTTEDSIYGDNEVRCKSFQNEIREKKWNLAGFDIVDVSDEDKVNHVFCENILSALIYNMDTIDDGILNEIRSQMNVLFDKYMGIQRALMDISISGAKLDINRERDRILNRKWYTFYSHTFMKALKEYKEVWQEKSNTEYEEFRNKIENILEESKKLIPSVEILEESLGAGGNNRPVNVFIRSMDKMRNDFTEKFLGIDQDIFDDRVKKFKGEIVDILAGKGALEKIIPKEKEMDDKEWLIKVSDELFVEEDYGQFKTAC